MASPTWIIRQFLFLIFSFLLFPVYSNGQDSTNVGITAFSDTTSQYYPSSSDTEIDETEDWVEDNFSSGNSLLQLLTNTLSMTGILLFATLALIFLFPLAAIVAIIILLYKLGREKQKAKQAGVHTYDQNAANVNASKILKFQSANQIVSGVLLLLFYAIFGWNILLIGGTILLALGAIKWKQYKQQQKDEENNQNTNTP